MNKYKIILILVIALAAVLRFYKLGQVPVALDWDETSMGYNAWALATTGYDEFGNSWPLTIRSFNDYKPPLYTYLLIPSVAIWGRNEFAIRFPSALVGTLTVLVTYFLVKVLLRSDLPQGDQTSSDKIAVVSAFLLAISPWHLQFSRVAFETNLGLFWFVTGMWLFLKSMREKSYFLVLSALSLGLGMMSYHSNRVITPIMILILAVLFRNELKNIWRKNGISIGISAIIMTGALLLIGYTLLYQKVGQARFIETGFISTVGGNGILGYGKKFLSGYLDHYNLKFWFLNGDGIGRHQAPNFGLLYWWELPLMMMGIISLISQIGRIRRIELLFVWFLLAPMAAALAKGTPSAVRSLLFLPTFQIFEGVGVIWLISQIRRIGRIWLILLVTCYLSLVTSEVFYYLHQYYKHGPLEQAADWQYGYKQLAEKLTNEGRKYDQIIVTTAYDQPYIYFLWYGNYFPKSWINNGEFNKHFGNFKFQKIDLDELKNKGNILVIGSFDEMKDIPVKWKINYPDGRPAFMAAEYL